MIDAVFGVSPAGICGMNDLAIFLNELRRAHAIADWQPKRAVSDTKNTFYAVRFESARDASHATDQWKARGHEVCEPAAPAPNS